MNSSIYAGLRWLLVSPIQHPSGGVCLDYRVPDAEFGSISTEATAWYIQGLLGIGEVETLRVERAAKAGRYLMESAFDMSTDLFLTHPNADGSSQPKTAEFVSCTVAIRALTALFRATLDSAYLECAARCSRAMRMRMTRVDGSFFPSYDVPTQTPLYERDPDVDQLKAAVAWTDLSEASTQREHAAPIEQLQKWALRNQQLTLSAPSDPAAAQRRYALFLEGLLPAAAIDFVASQALQAGVARLEGAYDDTPIGSRSPSVLARLLRLRLIADSLGIIELHHGRASEEASTLRALQVRSNDSKIDGGFGLAPRDELEAVVDPESVVVSLQALEMWRQSETETLQFEWQDLI